MNARVSRGVRRAGWVGVLCAGALALVPAAQADAPGSVAQPARDAPTPRTTAPTQGHAGALLAAGSPPVPDDAARDAARVMTALAELSRTPGADAATGALAQAREALARAARLREEGDTRRAVRALAVARAALELAGRQAALAREQQAGRAATQAREAARARARAAREALDAVQRDADAAAHTTQAGSDAASDTREDAP